MIAARPGQPPDSGPTPRFAGDPDARPVPVIIHGGHRLDLLAPDLATVPWGDLCAALCAIPRFNGAFGPMLTVGGHSLRVARYLPPRLRVYGLLHDMHEALMGDITRPAVEALDRLAPGTAHAIAGLKLVIDDAVHRKARLPWPLPDADARTLKSVDDDVCQQELIHGLAGGLSARFAPEDLSPHPRALTRALEAALAAHALYEEAQP